jgi:hypothetical protein
LRAKQHRFSLIVIRCLKIHNRIAQLLLNNEKPLLHFVLLFQQLGLQAKNRVGQALLFEHCYLKAWQTNIFANTINWLTNIEVTLALSLSWSTYYEVK